MIIHALYKEISDQYGKSELVKTFLTRELAEDFEKTITDRRTYIKEVELITKHTKI